MPNIMLTYRCNLKCPYCFANEFVNTSATDMTLDNFDSAVDFITAQGPTRLGLIGGEPTLHPNFDEILLRLINNPYITETTIYTNGLLLDKYAKLIVHPKFRLLINWNSPNDIGQINFERTCNNVDELILEYRMKDRINIGINLYDVKMDYTYIKDLLIRYNLHRLRISLTVPDFSVSKSINAIDYFKKQKKFLFAFFKDMDSIDVLPYYDCNKPPYCIWSEEEKNWLEAYVAKYKVSESTIIGYKSYCYPVIDILPNLQAVRCFGMSDFEKVEISDFNSVTDLANYFLNNIDACAYKIPSEKDCTNCYEQKTRHCTSGCIGFKEHRIKEINTICSDF